MQEDRTIEDEQLADGIDDFPSRGRGLKIRPKLAKVLTRRGPRPVGGIPPVQFLQARSAITLTHSNP